MVRHNNMIPNGHFHKKWHRTLKIWFDQPSRKLRRKVLRAKKARQTAPKPTKLLRPLVHCPSARYNSKVRAGRGFTLQELKQAGMNGKQARTLGIAVDHRRRNKCIESLAGNVQRLKEYQSRLVLLPVKKTVKFDDGKSLNTVKAGQSKVKARKVTEEEKRFEAFVTLRRARSEGKSRKKKKVSKGEDIDKNC